MKGLFITFEGIDGSGKTTQIKLLHDFLVSKGFDVLLTIEPGGTAIGNKIRDILLDSRNHEMDYRTETLLFLASRAELVKKEIIPSLEKGKIVICDRFYDSTIVYQGIARGLGEERIEDMCLWATDQIMPDLTFLLDMTADKAEKRIIGGDKVKDRIEMEELEFREKISRGYLKIAGKYKNRFRVLSGDEDIQHIFKNIREYTTRLLKDKKML